MTTLEIVQAAAPELVKLGHGHTLNPGTNELSCPYGGQHAWSTKRKTCPRCGARVVE
jgi:hypothetical protein